MKKFLKILLYIILGMIALIIIVAIFTGDFSEREKRVLNATNVNVRTGPGTNYDAIDETIEYGTELPVFKDTLGWIKVQLKDSAQESLWVKKEFTISKEKWQKKQEEREELTWYEKLPAKQKSKQTQKKRENIIRKLIDKDIIYKTEPYVISGDQVDKHPRVHVDYNFYNLKFDQKRDFMNAIATYYSVDAKKRLSLIIVDANSGKKVGSLDHYGLHLD